MNLEFFFWQVKNQNICVLGGENNELKLIIHSLKRYLFMMMPTREKLFKSVVNCFDIIMKTR